MRLVLNASVYSHGVAVKEEICLAMDAIDTLHKTWASRDAEFTAICDGVHKIANSAHYKGLACDLRFWYIAEAKRVEFRDALQSLLGSNYEVLLEKDHYHIEYDPKR